MIWKVVSSDGHPTSGEYFFTVTVGDAATTDEPTAAPDDGRAHRGADRRSRGHQRAEHGRRRLAAGTSAAIWIVSIVAVLVVAGVVVWIVMSRRRGTTPTDSDPSSER